MSLTKLSLAGIIKIFPARESLISDIPAREGKPQTFFYSEPVLIFYVENCYFIICSVLYRDDEEQDETVSGQSILSNSVQQVSECSAGQ
jgi:hypothetical protein